MFLNINAGSVYGIISFILLFAIIIFVLRFFGNIFYALFCYGIICCCKKQAPDITPIITPIPTNAIHTIVPFAEAIIQPNENTESLTTAIKITR
jgi:hypothetical protein